jgi:hypothetical protein
MSDTPGRGSNPPIIFRIISSPAGWRIIGADSEPMATLYLSRRLAVEHAHEMVAVLKTHGQPASVIVEGECPAG